MSTSTTTESHPPIIALNTTNMFKLNKDNFISWRPQIRPFFHSQSLFGYLDGSTPSPPPYLASSSSTTDPAVNPDHAFWAAQDQMNLSVLISLISEPLLPPVISFDTSHEVWHTLEKMFASQSKARVMHTWL